MKGIILPLVVLVLVFSAAGQQPVTAEDYFKRANTSLDKGDYDAAIADCTQAIRLRSIAWGAFNDRGKAYQKRGNLNAAIAELYYLRGIVYRDQKKPFQAAADMRQALKVDPSYEDAKNKLARLSKPVRKGR